MMGPKLTFWQTVVDCLKSLLIKAISFKNIGFAVGTVLGVKMGAELGATFTQWAGYMLILLVLFFTANQFQKWLFGLIINNKRK
jgi:predicted MFS family arabinose efflux permease